MKLASALLLLVCSVVFSGCQATKATSQPTTVVAPTSTVSIKVVNHIVFMLQENRSFDHYFGHLPQYWAANAYPQARAGFSFDGEPSTAANPAADGSMITAFNLVTQCVENPSPSWDESHADYNHDQPTSPTYSGNGFVRTAAADAIGFGFHDTEGRRAMGYYTGDDLNYYYFLASNFATSDRWFSPVMARSQLNRMYLIAGTSAGHVNPVVTQLGNKTIFQLLEEHGISWKIYVTDYTNNNPNSPETYLSGFAFYSQAMSKGEIVPVAQFKTDAAAGKLPQVAMIESGYSSGRDEHPSDDATVPNGNVQTGSTYVSSLINALMNSPSWKDSVFILSWDEFGGFYDHVPPQPAVNPDGLAPQDLKAATSTKAADVCWQSSGVNRSPTCTFDYTGYRVPLIVVSPFTKKNYVSHTVADYTAILKFIETRFKLPSLTKRDAAQPDMTDFFDFSNRPWETPPAPPAQIQNANDCYLDHLP